MRLQRLSILAGIALTATVALAACGTDNNTPTSGGTDGATASGANCATGTLNAQGSTAQANAISTWIKNYNAQCSGATINYQGTGSGAGQTASG